jgi:hypothetical protein
MGWGMRAQVVIDGTPVVVFWVIDGGGAFMARGGRA